MEPPPPVDLVTPTVSLGAGGWEQLVDPTDLAAGVQAVRGELQWRARGPQGTRVEIEARSEDRHGNPGGRYPDWTVIVGDRSVADVATVLLGREVGEQVRLRAKATAPTGEQGFSRVLSLRLVR